MSMEGSTATSVKARMEPLYRGLRPGHGIKGTDWEPGRSGVFFRQGSSGGQTEEGKEATTMLWKSDQLIVEA